MKIKFTKHLKVGNHNPNFDKAEYAIGEIMETSDAVGQNMIDGGFAIEVKAPAKKKRTAKKVVKKTETK